MFNFFILVQWSDKVQLSDIKETSELEYLNVKQLKNLLSTNRVDYKGCIERQELLNKVTRLWNEYNQSRKGTMCYIYCLYMFTNFQNHLVLYITR